MLLQGLLGSNAGVNVHCETLYYRRSKGIDDEEHGLTAEPGQEDRVEDQQA